MVINSCVMVGVVTYKNTNNPAPMKKKLMSCEMIPGFESTRNQNHLRNEDKEKDL